MSDTLSTAQERLMKLINDQGIAQLVGSTLAEIAVELMDAKQEAAHWKKSFDTVRDEIKILAAVAMRKRGEQRLVITRAEFAAVPPNTELWLDTPEEGVRVYEIRQRMTASEAAAVSSGALALHRLSN